MTWWRRIKSVILAGPGFAALASCAGPSASDRAPVTAAISGVETAADPRGRFYARECWFELPSPRRIDCGEIEVPENWDKEATTLIHLPVVVFRAPGRWSSKEPIVMLSGGPGGRAHIDEPNQIMDWLALLGYAQWAHDRDVIVLAQRGTNRTDSNLSCPDLEIESAHLLGQELLRNYLVDCGRQLDGRYDLAGYNSLQSARDLLALRTSMGLDSWSIYAVSYGTRFALTVMKLDPAGIRSVVLDSVLPPSVDHFADNSAFRVEGRLDAVFAGCRVDPMCSRHYPDPAGLFRSAMTRLEHQPIRMRVGSRTVDFDSAILLYGLSRMLAQGGYGIIPGVLEAFATYSENDFWRMVERATPTSPVDHDIAIGAFMAISCNDWIPQLSASGEEDRGTAAPPDAGLLSLGAVLRCQDWPSFPAGSGGNDPIVAEVPALLLAGEFDPITPPAYAEFAAATLSRSHLFVLPAVGHGVLWSHPCGSEIIAAFLEEPAARPAVTCPPGPLDFSMSLQIRAASLALQGRMGDVEELLEQVLEQRERILAPGHPGIAETLGILGGLYYEQGRLAPAQKALERALAILAKAHGPDSAEAGSAAGHLAMVYHDQERLADAQRLYRRALRALERQYGQYHPDVILYRRKHDELRSHVSTDGHLDQEE